MVRETKYHICLYHIILLSLQIQGSHLVMFYRSVCQKQNMLLQSQRIEKKVDTHVMIEGECRLNPIENS